MREISYTLLTDGTSDQALIPILTWLLEQHLVGCAIQSEWADLARLPRGLGRHTLSQKISNSLEIYPCDLLFVHRDAEAEPRENRVAEIRAALAATDEWQAFPVVPVVPVRMQEAWLVFDERAIRRASGNPKGTARIVCPSARRVEREPDPKVVLHSLLRDASELRGRRLNRLNLSRCSRLVSEHIDDFTPLRLVPAFQELEIELQTVITKQGW